jgi:hypothetical protein
MAKARRKPADTDVYEFPYVAFHGKSYPLIPLRLTRGTRSVNTFGLLDSGASISVFRPEIAKALGIRPTRKGSITLGTANGGVDISVTEVNVRVAKTKFRAKIGFSERHAVNFNIIGREGFFPRFSICFNEIMRTVVMVPLNTLRR